MKEKNKVGRPKLYKDEMKKRNLRLPMYIWKWLDNYAENRTQALIKMYKILNKDN